MRDHLYLQVCVLSDRNWKGPSASPPFFLFEHNTHGAKVQPETTLPVRATALPRGELGNPAEVTRGRKILNALHVPGTVLSPFT